MDIVAMSIDRRRSAIDLAWVLGAITAGWLFSGLVLYPALGVPDNAPLILRPILGFLAAWAVLRWRGQAWSSLGFRRPDSLAKMVAFTALLFAAVWLTSRFVLPPLAGLLEARPSAPFLAYIRGNAVAFAGWLAIGWIVGGFIEELLFRGFLLNRIAALFRSPVAGAVAGALGQALLFGALHLYQGSFGALFAGTIAALYGAAYFVLGRNLWPLILVHGIWNSIGIWSVYSS